MTTDPFGSASRPWTRIFPVIGVNHPTFKSRGTEKTVKMEDLFIDVGLEDEVLEELIAIGDMVTLAQQPVNLQNDRYAGKAMDDRAGVVVMYLCLEVLAKLSHSADVYAVATVQEEVGIRGATVSTYEHA